MTLRSASVARSVRLFLAGSGVDGRRSRAPARGGRGWPANVRAVYDINFNGFNVGSFEFQSQAEQQSYTSSATPPVVLLGAFTWDGVTRSFGLIVNQAPKPAAFSFDFKSSMKSGSTRMEFAHGEVTDIKNLPLTPPKSDIIPCASSISKACSIP